MNTRTRKSKGMNFQKDVKALLLQTFNTLQQDDIKTAVSCQQGQDIKMSPAARKLIPYSFECKRQESLNIYRSIEQCKKNCKQGITPAVVFRKNHMEQ